MGDQHIRSLTGKKPLQAFTHRVIKDIRALEYMLGQNLFETNIRRIGVEQEMFLVDAFMQPDPCVEEVLKRDKSGLLVPEIARFNLEANMQPVVFGADCLDVIYKQLESIHKHVISITRELGAHVVLTGILPTIHMSDLSLSNLTPRSRFFTLNEKISGIREGPATLQIQGIDELYVRHDTIVMEGCNTSFQTHFQVAPEEFARLYNIAQVVAAPVLAASVNSPILFGKRLWRETRIALFHQAVDTRNRNLYLREMSPRVHFGSGWVRSSVTELFIEDIARFQVLFAPDFHSDSMDALERGEVPELHALQLHNGTVYRWNRPCYGITDGKPHLRIENRILSAGPTIRDEVASAAFWFGLVNGLNAEYEDVTALIDFDQVKHNFFAAARLGLLAQLVWLDGRRIPSGDLILNELIPLARRGLDQAGIDARTTATYLNIISERVITRQTGAEWQLKSLAEMKDHGTRVERLSALVAAMIEQQEKGEPVHTWPLASIRTRKIRVDPDRSRVEQYMTTDLFTVDEDEPVDLVALLMDWRHVHHIPVEDERHHLLGMVDHGAVIRYLSQKTEMGPEWEELTVRDVMTVNPVTITPDTTTSDAIRTMRTNEVTSLPVVRDGILVGIVTERDLLRAAGRSGSHQVAGNPTLKTGEVNPSA